MQDIKVYHSIWKYLLCASLCLIFAGISLCGHRTTIDWIMLVVCVFCALFFFYQIVRERFFGKPFLFITSDAVFVNSVGDFIVRFADVEKFILFTITVAYNTRKQYIGIKFKKDVELKKNEEANKIKKSMRNFNVRVVGAQESLPADGLNIRAEELLYILNERLEQYKMRHK